MSQLIKKKGRAQYCHEIENDTNNVNIFTHNLHCHGGTTSLECVLLKMLQLLRKRETDREKKEEEDIKTITGSPNPFV